MNHNIIITLFLTVLLSICCYGDGEETVILPETENCGEAVSGETFLFFQTQEVGFDYFCDQKKKNCNNFPDTCAQYPHICDDPPDNDGIQIYLQQYKPKTLPYQLEEVCGMLYIDFKDTDHLHHITATMYIYSSDPSVDFTKELPRPYRQLTAPLELTIYNKLVNETASRWWYSVMLPTPLPIWEETIFIGFGWKTSDHGGIWRNFARNGEVFNSTPWYMKIPSSNEFTLNSLVDYNDRDFDRRGTLAISAYGQRLGYDEDELKDAGWTCSADKYNDGICDCGCGLTDPDCLGGNASEARGCESGGVCLYGKCVYPKWDKIRCNISEYHDGYRCNCGCGGDLIDPDCLDAGILSTCRVAGAICNRSGNLECVGGWTCDPAEYGDGICTCRDCGIDDPDCADTNNPTDCSGEFKDFVCVDKVCRYPRAYTCPGHTYNDGRTCNCNCTVPDPDCEKIYSSIVNCPMDDLYSCDSRGQCVPARCGNDHVDPINNEECDGGVGCTECRCIEQKGYKPTDPPSEGCVPICGDGRVREPEQCEVGYAFCDTTTCMCQEDHPYDPEIQRCSGCGNGWTEPNLGEECDGGEGCTDECLCGTWYKPFDPLQRGCQSSGALTGLIVGVILGAIIIVTVVILLILYFKKWRTIPTRQPTQGNDVVIMQVDENGMIKVSTQNTAGTTTSTGAEPGTIQPGTVTGLQANALASAALAGSTSTVPTVNAGGVGGTGSVNVGTMTNTRMMDSNTAGAELPPPPSYSGLASSNAGTLDSAYAETMNIEQFASGAVDPSFSQTQAIPDEEENPALAQTVFLNSQG